MSDVAAKDADPEAYAAAIVAYDRAVRLRQERKMAEALAAFADIAEGRVAPVDEPRLNSAFYQALKCASRLGQWTDVERLAVRAIERFPGDALGSRYLGEALMNLDRAPEAEAALARAVELDPEEEAARALLHLLRAGPSPAQPARKPRAWPTRKSSFADVANLVRRHLLRGLAQDRFISESTTFTTLGSCFAHNLALRLRAAGHLVNHEEIGEEVNSTFANRYLLDWIERGAVDAPTSAMDQVYGPAMRERIAAAIRASDVFVLTIGVAPCFFHHETGEFMFSTMHSNTATDRMAGISRMRTTTVGENVKNIRRIMASVQRIAGRPVKMVLTVSPVPLAGTTEFASAVIADCLSKSTLRLACQEVVSDQGLKDVFYWPSFEIVRWLGTHFGSAHPDVYGADDGNSRHVSAWLVDIIVDLFLEHFGPEAPAEA